VDPATQAAVGCTATRQVSTRCYVGDGVVCDNGEDLVTGAIVNVTLAGTSSDLSAPPVHALVKLVRCSEPVHALVKLVRCSEPVHALAKLVRCSEPMCACVLAA
jgi:hypothetical protein